MLKLRLGGGGYFGELVTSLWKVLGLGGTVDRDHSSPPGTA